MGNTLYNYFMGERRGLNPRHAEPQTAALPTELRPPYDSQKYHFISSYAKRICYCSKLLCIIKVKRFPTVSFTRNIICTYMLIKNFTKLTCRVKMLTSSTKCLLLKHFYSTSKMRILTICWIYYKSNYS